MTMTTAYRPLSGVLLLFVALASLTFAGCDSSGGDADGRLLVPNTSNLSFQTDGGESDTLSVTLVYKDLSERPQPDETPSYYTVIPGDESGTPADGETEFSVVFTAPEEAGSYALPLIFRSGDTAVTVRLAGISTVPPVVVNDFSGSDTGYFAFGGAIGLSLESEQMRIDMTDVGGSGVFPGIVTVFDQVVDFEPTPVVSVRMKATSGSNGPVRIRAALNQDGPLPDANPTVPELLATVPADDTYRTYYFDFRGNFVQYDGQSVNPSNIKELVFLFNDNIDSKFTGTLYMDDVIRRADIPQDAVVLKSGAAPAGSFTSADQ